MINLATLTGAVMVALGQHHAGLFSNDDKLSEALSKAGRGDAGAGLAPAADDPAYDKMIDSKFADMKNTGGRLCRIDHRGAVPQAFRRRTPWAHLDIAGTAMGSPKSDDQPVLGVGLWRPPAG
jgi:leucyl aminopeptidase